MTEAALKFSTNGHEYSQPLALLWFSADWCDPCKQMTPVMHQLARETTQALRVLKVDIDQQMELATEFQIKVVPSLVLLQPNGELARRIGEPNSKQLTQWLAPYLHQFKGTGENQNEQ